MKDVEPHINLVDGYIRLMSNLSSSEKLDIISKLTAGLKEDPENRPSAFFQSFGAFESDLTAEEMIAEIRESRLYQRKIESF